MVIVPIVRYATAQPQNATFVGALVGAFITLLGILATQIVNTILARTGQKNEQKVEEQRARAASLESYLKQMGDLLLNHQLRSSDLSNETDSLRVVSWAGTLLVGRRVRTVNLELPPIGWQLFILGNSKSDSTAFPLFLDTYATRLLAEPLRS